MFPRRALRLFWSLSVSLIGERGFDAAWRCLTMDDVIGCFVEMAATNTTPLREHSKVQNFK
jgi:hypothetical protein